MNKKNPFYLLTLVAIVLLASACTENSSEVATDVDSGTKQEVVSAKLSTAIFKVVDKFEIGENIYARSLLVAGDSLWVGTSSGLVDINLTDHSLRKIYTRADGMANEYVFAVGEDHAGDIWLGTNGGGMSRLRDGEIKTYFPMHGLADYWIYAFAQQKSGEFWIGTWAGANKMDVQSETFETYVDELINEWVYGLDVDSQDRVWFGTEGGMSMFDGQSWHHWTHEDGLGADNVHGLPHSDNTGLGTRKRHDLNVMVGTGESYNPNYIFSVVIDQNDHVWAGTWGAGVSKFDGQSWTSYSSADGLSGNIVYSSMIDLEGNYWFGTNRGLSVFDGSSWKRLSLANGFPETDVYALAQDKNGHIWAGTKGAVLRIEKLN